VPEDFADGFTAGAPHDTAEDLAVGDLAFADDAPPPDQGDSVFPALAEVHRREGRPDEAEQVARRGLEFEPNRSDGKLVLALSLLDQGDPGQIVEARRLLEALTERVLEVQGITASSLTNATDTGSPLLAPPIDLAEFPLTSFDDELSEQEIDLAFEDAATDPDQVIDADHVAQQAMRQVDGALDEDLLSTPEAPFATRTMADLLERQGDSERASRIRAVLAPAAGASANPAGESEGAGHGRRQRIIIELEGWLENLRRPRA
jgi:hypothetical protein